MKENFRITNLRIKGFRGLKDLCIKNCGDINILLGNNNCGKTSILESILLFKKNTINNLLDIIADRTIASTPTFNDLNLLFPIGSNEIQISASTKSLGEKDIFIKKEVNSIIFNKDVFLVDSKWNDNPLYSSIIDMQKLHGQKTKQLLLDLDFWGDKKNVSLIPLDLLLGRYPENKDDVKSYFNIVYQSPSIHFASSQSYAERISGLLANSDIKQLIIHLLKLFDETIDDILILPSDNLLVPVPEVYIKDKKSELKPISVFGDGIKKALIMAIYSINAQNGILLIDEIETSLHHKYFEEVFSFLFSVAHKLNVQLFISTHSDEVIDSMLDIVNSKDFIDYDTKLYTLKQKGTKTLCRMLNKEDALKYKRNSGLEVRD